MVLIDFWATWCQPCKKEMPGYQKLADRYGAQGFAVIGFKLDIMADTEEPRAFARRLGIRYPLAVATDEVKNKFGGIEGLPTTFIYDRQGILRQKIIGFEYTDVIEKDLKTAALRGKPINRKATPLAGTPARLRCCAAPKPTLPALTPMITGQKNG